MPKLLVPIIFIIIATLGCTRLLFREALVHKIGEQPVLIRGSQPDAQAVDDLFAKYRIKTIVNLRGTSEKPWYQEEEAAAKKHGIKIVNIPMNSQKPLQEDQVKVFLETVSNSENWPVFTHCHGGSHRTGAMVVVYRKQFQNWDTDNAIAELKEYSFNVGWDKRQKILKDISIFETVDKYSLPQQQITISDYQKTIDKANHLLQKYDNNHRNIPLWQKAFFMEEDIQENHQNIDIPHSSAYLSLYLASQVFRFAVTKEESVLRTAQSLLRNLATMPKEYNSLFDYSYLMFGYGVAHSFLKEILSGSELQSLRNDCTQIAELVFAQDFSIADTSISQKLAILSVVSTITQEPLLIQKYRALAIENAYLFKNLQPFWRENYRLNLVLAFNLYLLIQLEKGNYEYHPQLFSLTLPAQNIDMKKIYKSSFKSTVQPQIKNKNALINFLYYSCNHTGFSRRETILTSIKKLQEFPLIRFQQKYTTHTEQYIVPIDQRPSSPFFWENNPFVAGTPQTENKIILKYCSIDFLLTYWLGRYYQLIPGDI